MDSISDDTRLCTLCEQELATREYWLGKSRENLCEACFERRQVRDALEHNLVRIYRLRNAKRFDEALACLDAIWEANRHRDHDHWLLGSVAHDRGITLLEAGRYSEAEQAFRAWEKVGFFNLNHRQLFAGGLALVLEAMGRDQEAIQILEDMLEYHDPRDEIFALTLWLEVLRLSEKLGQPVEPKWITFPETVAKRLGLELPVADSPAAVVEALSESIRVYLVRDADDDEENDEDEDSETQSAGDQRET